ncbi:MAG: hypothetical protein AAFU65_10295 [Pseudomonadota bacterium]
MSPTALTFGLALLASAQVAAAPVTAKRDWTESFNVGNVPALVIDNIWGDINVRAGADDRITMAIRSVRQADDQTNFDRSLELLPLDVGQEGDQVFLRVGDIEKKWQDWPRCDGCQLRLDIDVAVPPSSTVRIKTITDGTVVVTDVAGLVSAQNINGPVRARGLAGCERIEAMNGDIDLVFSKSPDCDCAIETLNGDIALNLSAGTETNLAVALFHGKLFTDLDLAPYAIPPVVEYARQDGRHEYTVEKLAGLRLGRGGHTLTLKSLNGDVRVARSR